MKIRSLAAIVVVAAVGAAACSGDEGPSADEFADAMADICEDTQRDLERLDDPQDVAGLEDFAQEAAEVLADTRERLDELSPPDDVADDFADFLENVDDQIDSIDDLEQAGQDADEGEAQDVLDDLEELSARRSELGDDLGVDECVDEEETDETSPAETVPATDAPETLPPTSVPLTLPATVPQTAPPATAPPATDPPVTGPLFTIIDLTSVFTAPTDFTLIDSDPADAQDFIDIVAGVPSLNAGIDSMGVGVLLDDTGTAIATIVVGVAIADAMPGEWKDILCGADGSLRNSSGGLPGVYCPGPPDSGVSEIFTLTVGDTGLSVASLVDGLPADLVADAFLEAN